jgi:hypothetical protein
LCHRLEGQPVTVALRTALSNLCRKRAHYGGALSHAMAMVL